MTAYLIDVTADDIARGKRQHIDECPVALAISRTLKRRCLVSGRSVVMGLRGTGRKFRNPEWVANRIYKYDDTGRMVPFRFQLAADNEV